MNYVHTIRVTRRRQDETTRARNIRDSHSDTICLSHIYNVYTCNVRVFVYIYIIITFFFLFNETRFCAFVRFHALISHLQRIKNYNKQILIFRFMFQSADQQITSIVVSIFFDMVTRHRSAVDTYSSHVSPTYTRTPQICD